MGAQSSPGSTLITTIPCPRKGRVYSHYGRENGMDEAEWHGRGSNPRQRKRKSMRQSRRRHSSPVGSWALRLGHKSKSSSGVVVPFGTEEGLHAWLHPCDFGGPKSQLAKIGVLNAWPPIASTTRVVELVRHSRFRSTLIGFFAMCSPSQRDVMPRALDRL